MGSALDLALASPKCATLTHHLPFPVSVSVHIVPGEPEETDLILEEITDEWINKATCEMMAWGREAKLVTDACPLPPIQEEPQEEESR